MFNFLYHGAYAHHHLEINFYTEDRSVFCTPFYMKFRHLHGVDDLFPSGKLVFRTKQKDYKDDQEVIKVHIPPGDDRFDWDV